MITLLTFVTLKYVAIVETRWTWSAVYCNPDPLESVTWIQPFEVTFKDVGSIHFYGATAFEFPCAMIVTLITS